MSFVEETTESERSYPGLNWGRVLKINGLLVALMVGVLLVPSQRTGYLDGLLVIIAVVWLLVLSVVLNLLLALTNNGSRGGYLLAAIFHGILFLLFINSLSHMEQPKARRLRFHPENKTPVMLQ